MANFIIIPCKSFCRVDPKCTSHQIISDPFLRNPLWSDYLLHMQPLDEYQSLALLDLVKGMKWDSVALISSMDSYGNFYHRIICNRICYNRITLESHLLQLHLRSMSWSLIGEPSTRKSMVEVVS